MIPRRWFLRVYPRSWRDRYGNEVGRLLDEIKREKGKVPVGDRIDLARAAIEARARATWSSSRGHRVLVRGGAVVAVAAVGVLTAVGSGLLSTSRFPEKPRTRSVQSTTITTAPSSSTDTAPNHSATAARSAALAAQAQMQVEAATAAAEAAREAAIAGAQTPARSGPPS